MKRKLSGKELQQLLGVSLSIYFSENKYPAELNLMASSLRNRFAAEGPNTIIERGIITALHFFIESEFSISIDDQFLNQPGINVPANWRNNIGHLAVGNQNYEMATYYIRRRNQTFILQFTHSSLTHELDAKLKHTVVNHKLLAVKFRDIELMGLTDPQHANIFAINLFDKCNSQWKITTTRAEQDLAPTPQRTPLE